MPTLHYPKTVKSALLLDELLAAIPALAPVPGPDGLPSAVCAVEASATDCWVTVPAGTDPAAVDAVVAVHDPTVLAAWEQLAAADTQAVKAFQTGWVVGQARLGSQVQNGIQTQMNVIEAANITTVVQAAAHIKTLAKAVEDLAGQLRVLKRTVAGPAAVPDRLGG